MWRDLSVTVTLPCRNEGAHLAAVTARIPAFVDETIIVSNRSTDDTVAVAERLGLSTVVDDRVSGGIGYGYALITGMQKASSDIIVCADADGTYPIEEAGAVIDHLLDNDLDVVSCNRYPLQGDTAIPWKLRAGVGLLNLETRVLYGRRVKDVLSGMWAIRSSVLDELDLTMGDWNLSPQIKINAIRNPRIRYDEFPIVQHRRHGESHQSYFATGFSHASWILRARFAETASVADLG